MTDKALEPYEDKAAVRQALGGSLESVGLEVQSIGSAEERVRASPATLRSCLMLNFQLTQISGLDFQRQLSKNNESVPITFTTARSDDTARKWAPQGRALEFPNKPPAPRSLLSVVHPAQK
jgi:FixJ family two-component response regulator